MTNQGTLPMLAALKNPQSSGRLREKDLLLLLERIAGSLRWMHVEKLQNFDGLPGFTRAQGEN